MTTRNILFAFAVAAVLQWGRSGLLAQSLYTLPEGVDTRWASAENPLGEKGKAAQTNGGRKGRPAIPVKAGAQITLAEVRGSSGTVRRIWATISDRSPAMLRGLKIEMFWDGATKPAVSTPFGDSSDSDLDAWSRFNRPCLPARGQKFQLLHPNAFQEWHENRADK
jgi:hypothetical protein